MRPQQNTDHRPWPMPRRPWLLHMGWDQLLFAHWPVPADELRATLPTGLELDIHDGTAWVGIVPFSMRGVRPRCCPTMPFVSAFPELNVRTYVVADGKPGVWFFSLDAASRLAVRAARSLFHLPYFDARMQSRREADRIIYSSERKHRGAPPAEFRAEYGPTGSIYRAKPNTLEAWLTERYCLYTESPAGRLYRGDVQHEPWPLQPASASIEANTVAEAAGISLPKSDPLLHYVERIDTVAWWKECVSLSNEQHTED